MRKIIKLLCFTSLFTFCQCSIDIAGDDIGDLYGVWKLQSFQCNKYSEDFDSLFLGFQADLYSYQPNRDYFWGKFKRTEKELFLSELQWGGGDFVLIHLPKNEKSPSFSIDKLDKKELIISRNDSIWSFKKYLDK